jgi:uridine kinase
MGSAQSEVASARQTCNGDRLIVSVCGPSGSGKSTLAKALVEHLGPNVCARVPGDYYIEPRPPRMNPEDYFRQPLKYDWPLVARVLALPLGTATTTPDFDFEAFVRRAETGGRPFAVRPVMVVDAMYPYPAADVTLLIQAPNHVRRRRVGSRDLIWNSRVAERWHHLEAARRRLAELIAGRTFDLT